MMALVRSPESFSPQMNSTSLFLWFQLVIPSFDPKGHHINKIDKGLQGDATYQQAGHDGPGSLTRVIFPTNEFYIFVPLVPIL